ncbi:MAG: hypothetical protein OEU84_00410 [Xanthomonadales bacterium]|jgi:hypothetical protein|nr:hypothetical protein [Xanthomonadales bacterium]
MKKLLFFILAFSIHFAAHAADEFSTVEERMSGKEFKETGLGKLTDAELAALNEWLRRHSVATLENASARPAASAAVAGAAVGAEGAKDMRGFEGQPKGSKEDNIIYSTIVGTFNGWKEEGELFKLANGMIWQMSEQDTFYMPPKDNPEVTVTKGFMNSWSLSVVGYNSKVSVKRIQ